MPATTDTTQRVLEVLIPDDEIHELAVLRPDGMRSGFYRSCAELLRHVPDDDDTVKGVYFTPNPIAEGFDDRIGAPPRRGPRTKNEHMSTWSWLFLDIDPDHPTGTNATDEEKEKALHLLGEVRKFLSGHGFPDPIVIDSGNGFQAFYAVTPEAGDRSAR